MSITLIDPNFKSFLTKPTLYMTITAV